MADNYLIDYYENYNEDERLKSRWGRIEFLTTMRYIDRYLNDGMKVIDIGAGTGVYSLEIAGKGFKVDAVELIQHNVDEIKKKAIDNENVTVRQGNALDLSFIKDDAYDMTLLMGPMYHLYSDTDKTKAISEAVRVTKQNGIIFISYCITDASIIDYGFKKGNILDLIEKKMLDTEHFITRSEPWDIFELVRKSDIDELMSGFNTERLHYVATDGFSRHMKETIENMDEEVLDIFMKYHFAICENDDMVGITHHSLDIVRKL
ncbi:MAG TPA: class I SAM-dependent methyltransferase [Clostridia bacterium]|nr:class I SAM-dependent methyltransferase [Clostridia bacterium]